MQEYCFQVTKSLPRAPLDLPQRLATKALVKLPWSPWCRLTKKLLHQGRGSPHPPHKVSLSHHTKPEGRRRLPVRHLGPKGFDTHCTTWVAQDYLTRLSHLTLTQLKAKPSTKHTHKTCASLWLSNFALGWLGYDLLCVHTPLVFLILQQFQIGEWRGYK
jgi:hypothetical protein